MTALIALAHFTLRRAFTGKRMISALLLLCIAPLMSVVLCTSGGLAGDDVFHRLMIFLVTWLSAMLLSLIYAIALTSSEIEDGTASFVLLAALPKWLVVLVQTVVTAAGLSLMAAGSTAVMWGIVRMIGREPLPEAVLLWRYPFVTSAAILAYLSVFTFWGYAFRRGYAASIAVAIVVEAMIVTMPMKFAAYTITNNVRGLILSLALEGDPGPYFSYSLGMYDFPTYGQGAFFLSVVVGLSLCAAMVTIMNKSLVRATE